jgi:hypothetical protein
MKPCNPQSFRTSGRTRPISKLNYGLPHHLELDLTRPIFPSTAPAAQSASGMGNADPGIKWNLRLAAQNSHLPALGASLYIKFPAGDRRQQLSSRLADYWLISWCKNSTGALGIETRRGHVFPGRISLLHDFNSRLGGALYGGIPNNDGLGRGQLQRQARRRVRFRPRRRLHFRLASGQICRQPTRGR